MNVYMLVKVVFYVLMNGLNKKSLLKTLNQQSIICGVKKVERVVNIGEEKNFENRIKKFLKDENCWFIKYWGGSSRDGKTFTKSGVPDILCCCKGYFLGIEVKASNGKPSELQLYNLRKIDEAGGYAILLYPEDFATFKDLISSMNNGYAATSTYIYESELKPKWKHFEDKLNQRKE